MSETKELEILERWNRKFWIYYLRACFQQFLCISATILLMPILFPTIIIHKYLEMAFIIIEKKLCSEIVYHPFDSKKRLEKMVKELKQKL